MFTKKIKIILSVLLVALAIGYTALYHWTKNRFTELYQESRQQFQAEGWKIEEESPLVFSGFPFRLTATQEKLKITKQVEGATFLIEAKDEKMHVSIINPFKYSFEGDMSLSIIVKGATFAKVALGNGSVIMAHKDQKLEPITLEINNLKAELFNKDDSPLIVDIEKVEFKEEDYKITDSSDGKIQQAANIINLKNLIATSLKDGKDLPLVHLKHIKATSKSKLPQTIVEQVKAIFQAPDQSPMAQICQAGGKVPPLKATVELIEKIDSFVKLDLEIEHNAYTLNIELDAKLNKGSPEVLLTTQVNNLNNLFDAFNLDPTMRLIANGFTKKESDKSEKATIILKFSNSQLSLNDMELMKFPAVDWDNVVVPAELCKKYTASPAAVTTPAPVALSR